MNTNSKVLNWALVLGIIIVLNLFFNYALSLIYKHPEYERFCPTTQVINIPDTQNSCVEQGGQWTEGYSSGKPIRTGEFAEPPIGYCNLQFTCGNEHQAAQKVYDRNVFITLVLLGAICVAIGSFLTGNMLIGMSLSLAGVLSFIVASARYWTSANDLIKVIILAVALSILVFVALKKFKDN